MCLESLSASFSFSGALCRAQFSSLVSCCRSAVSSLCSGCLLSLASLLGVSEQLSLSRCLAFVASEAFASAFSVLALFSPSLSFQSGQRSSASLSRQSWPVESRSSSLCRVPGLLAASSRKAKSQVQLSVLSRGSKRWSQGALTRCK